MNRMRVRRALHYLAAVLGIALLVVLVRRTGTGTVIHQVRTIGWRFGLFRLHARVRFGWYQRPSLFSDFLVK